MWSPGWGKREPRRTDHRSGITEEGDAFCNARNMSAQCDTLSLSIIQRGPWTGRLMELMMALESELKVVLVFWDRITNYPLKYNKPKN